MDVAYKLINKWFYDDDLQRMCRVVKMGGSLDNFGVMEPTMFYTHLDEEGNTIWDSSSLDEVRTWVLTDKTNVSWRDPGRGIFTLTS